MVAVTIILTVTLSTTYSALQLWSLPPSVVRYFRETHFYLMYFWLVPIFWNFFSAMNGGPGYVPLGWIPVRIMHFFSVQTRSPNFGGFLCSKSLRMRSFFSTAVSAGASNHLAPTIASNARGKHHFFADLAKLRG